MQELNDITLLRDYAERGSEEAFAALVTRHINKVYSVAWRHTRNPHQAEEITQAVFVILAQKSGKLGKKVILSGWLYQTARLTAVTFIRSEIRRARREHETYMQTVLKETESDVWPQIAPLLDAAMARLSETDRHAVVLRFLDGKSMKEIGAALGASEDAAKMRVNRAVEKMRLFFTKRGVVVPMAALTAVVAANSVQAAPVALAKTATAVAMGKGATASISTSALIKGALKVMAWTKAKTAIVIGAAAILAAGTTTTLVVQHHHAYAQIEFPRSSWTSAGYADPVSAFETGLWAANRGDGKTLMAGCSPRMLGDTTAKVGRQMQAQGKSLSPEELFTQVGTSYIEGVTGFRILDKTISGNQAVLYIQLEGREEKQTITMKKIGEEWRIDDIQ